MPDTYLPQPFDREAACRLLRRWPLFHRRVMRNAYRVGGSRYGETVHGFVRWLVELGNKESAFGEVRHA